MTHLCYLCDNKRNKEKNISLHRFPLEKPEILKKWLFVCGLSAERDDVSGCFICSRHFLSSDFSKGCYMRNRLLPTAIPSVNVCNSLVTTSLVTVITETVTEHVEANDPIIYPELKVKEEILSDVEDLGSEEQVTGEENNGQFCSPVYDHSYVLKRPKIEPIVENQIGSSDYPIVVSPPCQDIQSDENVRTSTDNPDNGYTETAETLSNKNLNQNNPSPKRKVVFVKNTKNLALMLKSALKQCNFPKGTKLVRSIDIVEKGKARYRIVIPSEDQKKSSSGGNKELKIQRNKTEENTNESSKQTAMKTKIGNSNAPGNIDNQGCDRGFNWHDYVSSSSSLAIDLTSLEIHRKLNNKETSVSSTSPDRLQPEVQNTASEKALSDEMSTVTSLTANYVKLDKMIPQRMPIPVDILKKMEIKIPGIDRLRKSLLWRRLANAVAENVKAHYQKMYEHKMKKRQKHRSKVNVRNLSNLKERMKKDLLLSLKDTNYVLDDDTISNYIDELYYKANINLYSSKLLFVLIKNKGSKKTARRFSSEDKLFSLSIFKTFGQNNYNNLERIFPIPTIQLLYNHLNKVPFSPGLNQQVFENMRGSVSKLKDEEKYCSLIFDEIVLNVDSKQDSEETVFYKKVVKAVPPGDHVLVLILRGITSNWKHPVAFIVNSEQIEVINLVHIIKEAIRLTIEIGLNPVATIFNAKDTYIEAVKYLRVETEADCLSKDIENSYFGFLVGNTEIIPLFNSLNLFKETRDTLVNYDIEYVEENQSKIASWEHLLQLYSINEEDEFVKICPRLTEDNIIPKKSINYKEDSYSSIFSQRVSSIMKKLATLSANGIEDNAAETADFLYFMDKILDSCSGYSSKAPFGKPLKTVVTESSSHIKFWADAIQIITSFKYLKNNMNYVMSPIGDHWSSTLMGYMYLVDKLFKSGVRSIPMRNLNSEPLDNFIHSLCFECRKFRKPSYYLFLVSYRNFVLCNNNLCKRCVLNEETEFEKPFDVNRDYIYDEVPSDDDIVCCVHPECCNKE